MNKLATERRIIGEKIKNSYHVYLIAIPENNDDYIRVASVPEVIIDGSFCYNDNTVEYHDGYSKLQEIMTPEHAKILIPFYNGEKLDYVTCPQGDENSRQKLRDKLTGLTKWEYLNCKW